MNDSPQSDHDELPLEVEQRIDRLSDAFENEWKQGGAPRIEDYLELVPYKRRLPLLEELLVVEFDLLQLVGRPVDTESYFARFPGADRVIVAALAKHERHTPGTTKRSPQAAEPEAGVSDDTDSVASQKLSVRVGPNGHDDLGFSHDGKVIIGDYRIVEEISRGGMGVVYKAEQISLRRIVALKVIRPDRAIGQDLIDRFRYEAEAAANLDHPNIVPVFEVGKHASQHYLSMAYIAGGSLSDAIRTNPLPGEAAARYCRKIASAMQYAHQMGVLHRDLKPSNVLIDQHAEPRVADFGLAKYMRADRDLTVSGAVIGTPSFMSPEQARGDNQRIDERSDIYSLGALLFALITSRPPFHAHEPAITLNHVIEKDAPSPRTLNPAIARDLETICLKCLEKNPGNRYSSMREVADELDRYLKGEPIAARPPSKVARLARRFARNPALGLLSVFVLLTVVLGAALLASMVARVPDDMPSTASIQRLRFTDLLYLLAWAGPLFSLSKLIGVERTRQLELKLLNYAQNVGRLLLRSCAVTLLVATLVSYMGVALAFEYGYGQSDDASPYLMILYGVVSTLLWQTYLGWHPLRARTILLALVFIAGALIYDGVAPQVTVGEFPVLDVFFTGLLAIVVVASFVFCCISTHTVIHAFDHVTWEAVRHVASVVRSAIGRVPWPLTSGDKDYQFSMARFLVGFGLIWLILLPICLVTSLLVSVAFCFITPLKLVERIRQLVTPETPVFSDIAAYLASVGALVVLLVLRFPGSS